MTWKPHRSVDETIEFLRCCEQGWRDTSEFTWSLWMKSDGGFAGLLAIRGRTNGVDLGYALAQRWWRQGLMSEALMWVVEWALSHPEIQPSAAGAILSRRG